MSESVSFWHHGHNVVLRNAKNQRKNADRRKCRVTSTTPAGVKPQVPMYAYNPAVDSFVGCIAHGLRFGNEVVGA